MKAETGSKL